MQQIDASLGYVYLFGGPSLVLRDGPVTLSPHQSSLLALAYGSGEQGVSRSDAAWLLWESDDARPARHRISQLLYALKRRSIVPCIEEGRGEVLRGTFPSDTAAFLAALDHSDLDGLKAAAASEFLSGLEPPTAAFAHWVDAKRAALRKLLRDRAAAELTAAERAFNWTRAKQAAEILLELDVADEEALRALLKACALAGSQVEVDAALRSYAETYQAKLGERWSPERDTIALLTRIEAPELRLPSRTRSGSPPFVGRASDSSRLFDFLSSRSDAVRFAVVAGEPGIGKTRLIQETLNRLRLAGHTVLESGGSPLRRDLPLHSLSGALSQESIIARINSLEEPWRTSLRILLPEVASTERAELPALDPQATSRRLMEAIYRLLQEVTASEPTVLFLDDLQWLDKTTLCVLEFLCERSPALELGVVFGFRDDSESEPHVRAFLEVAKGNGIWIQLEELEPEATRALLQRAAPRRLGSAESERLLRVSGGNPFFAIELANQYGSNPLPEVDGAPEQVPSSVRQLISSRLEALSPDSRTLLQWLSVAGDLRPAGRPSIIGLVAREISDVADDLLRARLIRFAGGVVQIRHDLIRQAAYELMGPVKRSVLHQRAAEAALDRLGESGTGEAAVHFDRAGHEAAAFQYGIQAATAAQEAGAVAEAVRFWEVARRNAQSPMNSQLATRGLAELFYEARKLSEAIPLLESAEAGAADEAPRFTLMRLDALSELKGTDQMNSLSRVEEIAERALVSNDWIRHLEAVEIRIRMLERLAREDEICGQLGRVRDLDSGDAIRAPYAACLLKLILSLSVRYGDSDYGMDAASSAVQLAAQHGLDRLLLRAYHRKLFCLSLRAEIHSVHGRETVHAALTCATRGGDMRAKANIYNIVGTYYLDIKDHDTAERFLMEAAKLASAKNERVGVSCNLGVLFYSRGEYHISESHFQRAREEAEASPVFGAIIPFVLAGLGLCALATGRLRVAQELEMPVRTAAETSRHVPPQLVKFLAELERRRGSYEKALELVRTGLPADRRRPLFWIKDKLIEAKYLKLINRAAADELMLQIEDEAEKHGLRNLLT